MKNICIVIGSRANYSSIKSVMTQINKSKKLKLSLIVFSSAVSQKYGSVYKIIENDGFKINYLLKNLIDGEDPETMTKSTGLALIEIAKCFDLIKPDIVFTIGDRFETIAITLASTYMNIPLAHTMGGEVTGTIDESIRHANTKFAHIHFPATKKSAERIFKLGEEKKYIFHVGCPRIDLIKEQLTKNIISISKLNKKVFNTGVGKKFDLSKEFILVLQHSVTTEYNKSEWQITNTLEAVKKTGKNAIIMWPNPDAGSGELSFGIRKFREKNLNLNFFYIKNLPTYDYIMLMNYASCLVGNSSSAIRDGAYIGTPAVNIGTRQNSREKGRNVLNCNYLSKNIYVAILKQIKKRKFRSDYLYGDGNAGKKIVNILTKLKKVNVQKKIRY